MKRLAHAILLIVAAIPWLLGCLLFCAALLLAVAAHRLNRDALHGNCWTYVGPRWAAMGGYIAVRLSPDPKIFGRRFIPHAIWLRTLPPDADTEQITPVHRAKSVFGLWHAPYFKFRVTKGS